MKFTKLLLILLSVTVGQLHATDTHGGTDPLEKRYILDSKILPDQALQNSFSQSAQWQEFQKKNGKWYVSFDELSGMPHRASGKPVLTNGNTPVDAAISFVTENLSAFDVPMEDLKYQTENFSGKYFNVFYTQQYQGLEILNSRVFVKLTPDYKVSTFGLDIFHISGLSTNASISSEQIGSFATRDINLPIEKVSAAVLKILPLPASGHYDYRLVYELTVETMDGNKVPGTYYSLLDANTGELLYRSNRVHYSSDVTVTGTTSLISPFQPTQVVPLRNLKVDDGTTFLYTDSMGNINLAGASPVMATFTLAGRWSKIYTDGGSSSPITSGTFNSGPGFLSFDSITTLSHVSGYYHVNIVHDFMKSFFPSFTNMDISLATRINVSSGSCNAFYSGSSINFYSSGGGCNSMALVGDIVYHEYGHGINDKFYQWQGGSFNNGGMDEGYADVWGFSITQSPILGPGYRTSSSSSFIRRYDVQRKVYPQNITGEVHDDGEIIAGAWYDVAVNFGSFPAMTALFTSTYYDIVTGPDGSEGQVYTDILLSALNNDDNDGDLSNGTPNDLAIINAFNLHGISLLNSVEITHAPVLNAAKLSPIMIDASMAAQFPWYAIGVHLNYRTSPTDPWTTVTMSNGGSGITYSVNIPGQASGTIIEYYIESVDGSGTTLSTSPANAFGTDINIPYFILVDFLQQQVQDFDSNFSAAWLTGIGADNAASGQWVIEAPVASYTSALEICQTGQQHTVGGTMCAVTGNAPDTTTSNGYLDLDGGRTTLQSPLFDITAYSIPVISYWRWYTNNQGTSPNADFWRTYISEDGVNFLPVENLKVSDRQWRRFALKVHDYFPTATSVMLRFVAEDASPSSIVEAAVDDIEVLDVAGGTSVAELSELIQISIYPNPAGSEVAINFNSTNTVKGRIEIINALGQIVFSEKSEWLAGQNHKILNTANYTNGIYRIVLRTDQSSSIIPLSIMHD